ncbi:hypothetical protein Ae201684_000485 [Aphanomyces euteiches]|uniref:Uncharacterized protein n=1 Tax=Aphanomyces euteiches TaxID=100861 RepID=A0A6G0XXM8_9STRA|nr:hypothetical protein Ae201684_000485 [Aphanomyces euteiches]
MVQRWSAIRAHKVGVLGRLGGVGVGCVEVWERHVVPFVVRSVLRPPSCKVVSLLIFMKSQQNSRRNVAKSHVVGAVQAEALKEHIKRTTEGYSRSNRIERIDLHCKRQHIRPRFISVPELPGAEEFKSMDCNQRRFLMCGHARRSLDTPTPSLVCGVVVGSVLSTTIMHQVTTTAWNEWLGIFLGLPTAHCAFISQSHRFCLTFSRLLGPTSLTLNMFDFSK